MVCKIIKILILKQKEHIQWIHKNYKVLKKDRYNYLILKILDRDIKVKPHIIRISKFKWVNQILWKKLKIVKIKLWVF